VSGGHETTEGQVTDDAKPHLKYGTFLEKKKIQTYGEIQTMMNHLLQCLLKGTSCKKKMTYTRQTTKRQQSRLFE